MSAVVSAPFKLFGLAGIIIAYVLITPIATLVGAIAGGAVAGPFEVARYRYYLSLRKKWNPTKKSPASLMHLISLCNLPLLQECGC